MTIVWLYYRYYSSFMQGRYDYYYADIKVTMQSQHELYSLTSNYYCAGTSNRKITAARFL